MSLKSSLLAMGVAQPGPDICVSMSCSSHIEFVSRRLPVYCGKGTGQVGRWLTGKGFDLQLYINPGTLAVQGLPFT
ncbi:hypothetical protein BDV24DRAFT_126285 [Aspergillus arachidicola]|uniref:Uncharacterized protein n=1 Tax=Aspergillus arachidicola TaxID=656916 RepID=A0A5N6YI67_9EURO|nr:hypothetical protein BDV24DRAFT_126285 [Aspergillus arachidicola]